MRFEKLIEEVRGMRPNMPKGGGFHEAVNDELQNCTWTLLELIREAVGRAEVAAWERELADASCMHSDMDGVYPDTKVGDLLYWVNWEMCELCSYVVTYVDDKYRCRIVEAIKPPFRSAQIVTWASEGLHTTAAAALMERVSCVHKFNSEIVNFCIQVKATYEAGGNLQPFVNSLDDIHACEKDEQKPEPKKGQE